MTDKKTKAPGAATIGRSVRMIASIWDRARDAEGDEEAVKLASEIASAMERFTAALFSKTPEEIAELVAQFIADEKAARLI